MIGLQSENREDNDLLSIKEIEAEIPTSKEPATSVLKNILAELYLTYFQENRYKLYNRTKTYNYQKYDISSWDVEDFHRKITELFLASIKNEKLLQQTKVETFDAVIIKGTVRKLRPTLYDLLANRAAEYFRNDERDLKKPAYAFEIDQSSAFDPAESFINLKFITNDSLSLHHKALLIYQKLLAFHLNDENPAALIDADLNRLNFLSLYSVHPDKDELYINALTKIANKYGDHPAAAQAWYLIAQNYETKANEYSPYGDTTQRYARIKAKEIYERVLKQKEESEGWVNSYNAYHQMIRPHFTISLEKVNVPEQPFRTSIKYYNMTEIHLRIIKYDENLKKELISKNGGDLWGSFINANPVRSWTQVLPDTKDLQYHITEVKIEGLLTGEYIILGSDNKDLKDKKTLLGEKAFYVSNISYINNEEDFFVLNRDNGQPLAKASVQVWTQYQDYKTYKTITEKGKLYQTDEHGFFRKDKDTVGNNGPRRSFALDITYNNDRLFLNEYANEYYYRDYYYERDEEATKVFLFTDRSIYRPGQTVYFKGIAIISNPKQKTNAPDTKYEEWLYLRNANYETVDSIKVKSSEFGSFSGKFQLPQGGLNGHYSIYVKLNENGASFQVEEYKRPKFYVEYEKIKGTYKVNDKIKVTGVAKAFAGNNIDGAKVKYRVVREARFLYDWVSSWRWPRRVQTMEIIHGEIVTDADGKFDIEFTAIPDKTIDKKFDPVFDYKIYADVTDINGETRSGELSVSAGYKSLILKLDVPQLSQADSLKSILIRTENMNGEFERSKVTVTITKLKEEKRLIRKRYWDRPDQFVMTKEEYIKHFPYDEYNGESDFSNWARDQKVLEKTDSVKADGQWSLGKQLQPGFYVIEVTTRDKNNEEVKDVRYIELADDKSKQLLQPKYLWTQASEKPIDPGEKTSVILGTSSENLFVIQQIDRESQQQKAKYDFISLSNEKKNFEFSTSDADRGGFGTNWIFVKNNRVYEFNHTVVVSWNKDLKIEYSTFRDKVLPGSQEKWKIKISGNKKDKVAAEVLASMYDASLDEFLAHQWFQPLIWQYYQNRLRWSSNQNFLKIETYEKIVQFSAKSFDKRYDELLATYVFSNFNYRRAADPLWFINPLEYAYSEMRNPRLMRLPKPVLPDSDLDGVTDQFDKQQTPEGFPVDANGVALALQSDGTFAERKKEKAEVQIRKNFNETAFFFPDLKTNENGDIEFSFTMSEALTKWKFQALTHTRDLAFGYSSKEIITQKELMVQPNPPRFLREGDKIEFSAKIVNLTGKELTGQAELQLLDAATNESVSGWFNNMFPNQYFTVAAGQSEAITFPLQVPYLFDKALIWRIVARSGNISDGEEAAMPVLTNRMLVTETLPLNVKRSGTKNFTFEKLLNADSSETLQHQSFTVEFTSNPVWHAVQALPYLMEYPYECAEQTWNRYYANALASRIANSSPSIKKIFESWKTLDTAALLSNLQKNPELKAILLEETPWVLQAKTEEQQKKNIALLFDMVRMSNEMNSNYEKLKQMQTKGGAFVWFTGGPANRYITQYIVTGIGHLKKLGVETEKAESITSSAIQYLDNQIIKDYADLKKNKTDLTKYSPDHDNLQYLYMRSFFTDKKIESESQTAYNYFRRRAQQTWTKQSKYMQAMIALMLHRTGDTKTAAAILLSLKETSINNEELGRYWKENSGGWFWHQAPIETQALLIEAFSEIGKDVTTVDELKTWLLKNKQTKNWRTTKATAEACYALLLQGTDLLSNEPVVEIKFGNILVRSTDNKQEAGTGYFKRTVIGPLVTPSMGNISVSVQAQNAQSASSTTWGAAYWQYFENLDHITPAATPLKLEKKLFVETNSDRGPVLTPINEGDIIKVGDKIKVRIELSVDRDMEYVHMKDMRASCLEPVNVLSGYKWQGGLGYYESTKDASTNFFFDYLRKGTYVFEYPLFVTHTGNFSNGVTSIQCMYAPEFGSHSEGIRINVE
jgi:hypothetical protein